MAGSDRGLFWHSKMSDRKNAIRLALFAASLLLIGCRGGHPSDDSLQSRFFSHEASFTKVVQMATEDPKIVRIDPFRDLEPGVESLNNQAKLPCSRVMHCIVYRQLKRHWYIFYEIG